MVSPFLPMSMGTRCVYVFIMLTLVAVEALTYHGYPYLMKGPHDDKLTWPLKGKFLKITEPD